MSASEPRLGNITELGSRREEFIEQYGYTALRFFLLSLARELLPNERIQVCWRYPLPGRKHVEVIYSEERQRARASGTMKCGSVWVCPACSLFMGEVRREELGRALREVRGKYAFVMVTYTASHNAGMRLRELLDQLQRAYRKMHTGRTWQEIKEEFFLAGSVRAVEITHGQNGWHPHFHELLFINLAPVVEFYEGHLPEYASGLQAVMVKRWLTGLQGEGLSAEPEIALKVQTADDEIAAYIAKMGRMPEELDFRGATDEITRGRAKIARNGSQSVWDVLFDAQHNETSAALFREYAVATKGRSQLQWSRGLKSALGIDEIRDEIAAEGIATDTDILLAEIDFSLWRFIAERGYLGQVMTYANTGDADRFGKLLDRLRGEYEKTASTLPQFDLGM